MTVKELERQLDELARADLEAGELDSAVERLGRLAALELLFEEAAAEPGAAGDAALAEEAWHEAVDRAREHAQEELGDALPSDEEAAPQESRIARLAVPIAGLAVLLTALVVMYGASRAFQSGAATFDRGAIPTQSPAAVEETSRSTAAPAPTVRPTQPPAASRPLAAAPSPDAAASTDDTAAGADESSDGSPCVDSSGAPLPRTSWLCRGRAIRAEAPAEAQAPAPESGSMAPPYQALTPMRLGMPKRVRYEVNVVVPPSYTREQIVAVLADAVRKTLRQKADARAVGVFAYSSAAGIGTGWDRGRALASVDGQGWTGDRTFAPVDRDTRDERRIYVALGTADAIGERIELDR